MTLAFPLYNSRTVGLAALLILTACPPTKPDETGTDGDSSSDATAGVSTTSGDTTTGETPTTSGAMSDGTTGGSGGETTTTAGETTTEGTTGGPPPAELVMACDAACEKFFECIMPPPFPDKATCMEGCLDAGNGEAACVAASVAFDTCIAGLDCPAFENAVMNEEFGPCADAFMQTETACEVCESIAGVGPDGCSLGKTCPDMPTQAIVCEGDTCTCMVDDAVQSECAANGVCAEDQAALSMLAAECCGFDL